MAKWGSDFQNVDVFFKDSITTLYRKVGETTWKKGIFIQEGEIITFWDVAIQAESCMLYVNGNEYVPQKGDVIDLREDNQYYYEVVNVQNQYGIYLCTLRRSREKMEESDR
jgi:hypothetical protein